MIVGNQFQFFGNQHVAGLADTLLTLCVKGKALATKKEGGEEKTFVTDEAAKAVHDLRRMCDLPDEPQLKIEALSQTLADVENWLWDHEVPSRAA